MGRFGASSPYGRSLCWDLPRNPTQTSLFLTEIARLAHHTTSQHSVPPPGRGQAGDGSHIHATSVKTLVSSTHKILPKCALHGAPTFCGARRSAPISWDYRGCNSPTEPPQVFGFRKADIEICKFAPSQKSANPFAGGVAGIEPPTF